MDLIAGSFTLSMALVAAADVSGQVGGKERRSHFRLRVLLSILMAPAVLLVLVGAAGLHALPQQTSTVAFVLMLLCSPALLLVPSVLYRTRAPEPGDADSGGGSDPGQPPSQPDRPNGGLPLPDTRPGHWRVRDHRPDLVHVGPRRSAPEPERAPVPASPVNPLQ